MHELMKLIDAAIDGGAVGQDEIAEKVTPNLDDDRSASSGDAPTSQDGIDTHGTGAGGGTNTPPIVHAVLDGPATSKVQS